MSEKGKKVLNVFKKIGMGLSIGFNVVFLLAIVIGSTANKKQNNNVNCALAENEIQEVVGNYGVNKKFVSYNDESYSITLNQNELNNYTFENFFTCGESLLVSNNSSLTIGTYSYNSISNSIMIVNYGGTFDIGFGNGTVNIYNISISNIDYKFKFDLSDTPQTDYVPCEYDIVFTFNSEYYDLYKSGIELDIQANEYDFQRGIFETLTSGVVNFVGSIGSGIVAMTSVFYDSVNSELTTIGLLSVIVVAVSLAYFLFRLIIGLIRMRG